MGKPIDIPYSINQADVNFTIGADIAAGAATGVEHLFGTWQCPKGITLVITLESVFAAYLKDLEAAPAEFLASVPVRIAHTDASGDLVLTRIDDIYASVKDFADITKTKKFDRLFKVEENEKLAIYSTPPSGSSIDVSACYFKITGRSISKLMSI